MTYNFSHALSVVCALLRRDIYVLSKNMHNDFIDSGISLGVQYIIYGLVFPGIGMPKPAVADFFWGIIVFVFLNAIFDQAYRAAVDFAFYRRINYFTTLPMGMHLFLMRALIVNMLEIILVTVPLIIGGSVLFSSYLSWNWPQFPLFVCIYFLSVWFSAACSIVLGFVPKFQWVRDNLWVRVIMPMAYLSPIYYALRNVWNLSPWIGRLFLLSPFSYIAEGLRSSTTTSPMLLSAPLCAAILLLLCCTMTILAYHALIQRLDAVVEKDMI